MVTSRDRKSFGSRIAEKIPKVPQTTGTVDIQVFRDPLCGELTHVQIFMNDGPNPLTWDAIDLAEIRRSSKLSSWILSITSGVVTALGCPGRGALQVKKSPCLNWATQFLTLAYNGACLPNGVNFLRRLALQVKKKAWWQLASRCCWNRARRLTCFLSAPVTRKYLQFGTWTDPSFQRHYRFRPTTSGSRSG